MKFVRRTGSKLNQCRSIEIRPCSKLLFRFAQKTGDVWAASSFPLSHGQLVTAFGCERMIFPSLQVRGPYTVHELRGWSVLYLDRKWRNCHDSGSF